MSLIALGSTFIGTALLLMFNPGSREVRWYAAFNVTIMTWLALQAWALMTDAPPSDFLAFRLAIHVMPAVFLAAAIAQGRTGHDVLPFLIVAGALLVFPAFERASWTEARYWHVALWSGAAGIYLWRALRGRGRRLGGSRRSTRREKFLELVLSGFVPIGVIGAIVAQGSFVLIVLPLLTVVIMLLIFSGVVYHRYYDIEVKASRTGELAASAAEHDRLALLGELSATIAHEVRNPLTGIRSLTQMLAEPDIAGDKRIRYAGVVLDEVARLDRIVTNLTDLARRSTTGARSSSETTIGQLFEDLKLLVDARARRASVSVGIDDRAGLVYAPREALAQALLNLLLNAIAHSPAGSEVTLSAEAGPDHVVIGVADQGPGVPAADRERIFEAFTTQGGTGLGLAVVRRLADEHGWAVTVDGAHGGGARFTITIRQAVVSS